MGGFQPKPLYFLFVLIILYLANHASGNPPSDERTPKFASENSYCLSCHGQKTYYFYHEWMDKMVKERMNPYYIIDSVSFYQSNHYNFRCTDCHPSDYETFPHPGELRMELQYTCMDCHGGDDNFAEFQFERIEEEFMASVHSTRHSEDFTCWMCHNPHTYHISARRENIPDVVAYDNEICLSCHADANKFQLLTDKENPNILSTHDWLPNQKLHFLNVRCIECHAQHQNDMLVAHNIKPKEEAVRLCEECHSQNSLLFSSLYKYQLKESRKQRGFLAAPAMDWQLAAGSMGGSQADQEMTDPDAEQNQRVSPPFIIGSMSNPTLNLVSLILFFSGILALLVHILLRVIYKTN